MGNDDDLVERSRRLRKRASAAIDRSDDVVRRARETSERLRREREARERGPAEGSSPVDSEGGRDQPPVA